MIFSHRVRQVKMQSAQPILSGLHDLTVILTMILAIVLAGTVGYFIYAAKAELEP
jgi:hypothetical protein